MRGIGSGLAGDSLCCSKRRLTEIRKASIIYGSVFEGKNNPTTQADKESVDVVLDEVLKVPHNSASLLLRTQRFDSAAQANEFVSSLKINSR